MNELSEPETWVTSFNPATWVTHFPGWRGQQVCWCQLATAPAHGAEEIDVVHGVRCLSGATRPRMLLQPRVGRQAAPCERSAAPQLRETVNY